MSLRGTAVGSTSTSVSSLSIAYSGTNIQVGDLLIATILQGAGGSVTITDPSGWTAGSALSPAIPDVLLGSSVQRHIAVKIATAADAGTPSYSWSSNFNGYWVGEIRVYAGRVNSSVSAAFGNNAVTAAGTGANTPYTYSLTGLTALAGDDIVVVAGAYVSAGGPGTALSGAITGYGNEVADFGTATSNHSPIVLGLDQVNAVGGATGSLSLVITSTPTLAITPSAVVFSLPKGASGVPGQFFFGDVLKPRLPVAAALFMPLSWAIDRRNKRAAERRAVRDTLKRGR